MGKSTIKYRGGKPKVYLLDLIHLLALAYIWPHPVARDLFETELKLKRLVERKILQSLDAYED